MWCLLRRWSATTTALPSRGLGQGALDADELLEQSSVLGAAGKLHYPLPVTGDSFVKT